MINVQENVSLKNYNTFGIDVNAKLFCEVNSIEDLLELSEREEFAGRKLILGGGSNVLLTHDFNGLVVLVALKGIDIKSSSGSKVLVSAMAGENWHEFVLWTLEQGLGGIENLSLIPGNIGTAPMQNIGAYGVELKDVFHSLEAFNIESKQVETFSNSQCEFGYRESIFKRSKKGKYIITKVNLELSPEDNYETNTSYGAITAELESLGKSPNIHSVSEAVINIRNRKLPNPKEIGNAGSFFKNPVVDRYKMEELWGRFPKIVSYELSKMEYKVAAGWLIEYDGWKGYTEGPAGIHKNQALVLVNHGGASGSQIESLSKAIRASIFRTFGIKLETEVNII